MILRPTVRYRQLGGLIATYRPRPRHFLARCHSTSQWNHENFAGPSTKRRDDEAEDSSTAKPSPSTSTIKDNTNSFRLSFLKRILFPYNSAAKVLSDTEMRDAVVQFSQQTGVVFTLLASISATGLFMEALSPVEDFMTVLVNTPSDAALTAAGQSAVTDSAACNDATLSPSTTCNDNHMPWWARYTLTHQAQAQCDINVKTLLFHMAAPTFCASTFFNLYGLVNATNVMGRAQIVPTRHIKDYVTTNSWVVHSTYWALIPAIGSFGFGVVCTIDHFYGEPLTTWAMASFGFVGLSQMRNLIALALYTEHITEKCKESMASLKEEQ